MLLEKHIAAYVYGFIHDMHSYIHSDSIYIVITDTLILYICLEVHR